MLTTQHTTTPDSGAHERMTGVVIKKITGQYTLRTAEGIWICDARNAVDLAVGDEALIQPLDGGRASILARLPRRNALARRSAGWKPGKHAAGQTLAANLDLLAAVFPAAPAPRWGLLDRLLVSAEACEIPALICITKLDLADDLAEIEPVLQDYRAIGYPVTLTSAASGAGLDELRRALGGGVCALIGKSGVGKTSLLNALQPGLGLRVQALSRATQKGLHTTTHVEMFDLGGAHLVDTPGLREFGLWEIDAEALAWGFPEMRPYLGACKFGASCRHDEEPGCAVRAAVMAGAISPRRYRSFQTLQRGE